MDKALKTKWIEALRSGKYKQTREKLCNGEAYCCLGVLAEVAQFPEWDGEHFTHEGSDKVNDDLEELPSYIEERIGLRYQNTLVRMNDGLNEPFRTFSEIADFIETNL